MKKIFLALLVLNLVPISAIDLGITPNPIYLSTPGQSTTTEIQVISNPTENFEIQFNIIRLNEAANNVAFDETIHYLHYGETIPITLTITMPTSNPSNFQPLLKINASKVINGPNNGSAGTLVAPEFSLNIIYGNTPTPSPSPLPSPSPSPTVTPSPSPSPSASPSPSDGGNGGSGNTPSTTPLPLPSSSPSTRPSPSIIPTPSITPSIQPTIQPSKSPPSVPIPTTPITKPIIVNLPSPTPPVLVVGNIQQTIIKKWPYLVLISIIAIFILLGLENKKLKEKIKLNKQKEKEAEKANI